jgi:hypothetical protein
MMKRLIVFFTFILISCSLFSQELISSIFSKDTILIGDQVEWSARVNVPKELTLWTDSLSNPLVPGVELIKGFEYDTLSSKKKVSDIEVKAIITSFDSGSYYIPRQVLYFYKGEELIDTIVLEAKTLEVTTIPVDTATYQMYDIKPQFDYPVTFKEILPWILGFIGLVVLILLIIKLINNRKSNKTLFGKPVVKDPPHITALRNLEKIRNEKLWQNNKEKQYYTAITDTLRQYIDSRFHVQTMERTSKEILDSLSDKTIQANEYNELKDLFEISDLVKFAKYSPSSDENERAIPSAVRFVNSTFMQELEGDNNEKKEVGSDGK